jgi:hypothetical protein
MRRIFGPKINENGEQRRLQNREDHHDGVSLQTNPRIEDPRKYMVWMSSAVYRYLVLFRAVSNGILSSLLFTVQTRYSNLILVLICDPQFFFLLQDFVNHY